MSTTTTQTLHPIAQNFSIILNNVRQSALDIIAETVTSKTQAPGLKEVQFADSEYIEFKPFDDATTEHIVGCNTNSVIIESPDHDGLTYEPLHELSDEVLLRVLSAVLSKGVASTR
ncbi:MAG: hypothetical protein ACKO96_17830, partial [Flammeovirgaceae bacterium]